MTQTKRQRAWSISDFSSLSKCLCPQNVQPAASSEIGDIFQHVQTSIGIYQSGYIYGLVREAQLASDTLQVLSYSTNESNVPILKLAPYSRHRSVPHGEQFRLTGRRLRSSSCQEPPKLSFGQPTINMLCPSECRGVPSLTNSLIIGYLARVTTDHPYVGLVDLLNLQSNEDNNGGSPASRSRLRNVGVTMASSVVISAKPSLHESNGNGASVYSSSSHHCDALSSRGLSDSACCGPSKTGTLDIDNDYRLRKLSTQVEVEHLRSMMHEFERARLFHTNSGRSSDSASASDMVNPKYRRDSRTLFTLNSISGFASPDSPRMVVPNTTHDQLDRNQEASLPSLDSTPNASPLEPSLSPQSSVATDKNPCHNSDHTTRRISRLEHNIIAPLSF
ncbi:hypothetical protein EGR_01599 [Echinococcus granulosus]|uniref:Uncharacterized protein n=1 Tax=Echinococcus granulosus TaxID=6210 RepID=W6UY36_ECHGR|nr:hypothetical protein EGR_01599 [Echinococcus granulosus]EUB63517.1 hypothetical protein EGR_01599 [Echinococcus granulosus]